MPEFHSSSNPKNAGPHQPDLALLRDHLGAFGQGHLLQFWEQLDPLRQQALARQVEQLDLGLIGDLYRGTSTGYPGAGDGPDWESLARRAEPCAITTKVPIFEIWVLMS